MLQTTLKRIASAIPSLIGVVIVTFLLTRVLPGDTASYFAGPAATPAARAAARPPTSRSDTCRHTPRRAATEPSTREGKKRSPPILRNTFNTSAFTNRTAEKSHPRLKERIKHGGTAARERDEIPKKAQLGRTSGFVVNRA